MSTKKPTATKPATTKPVTKPAAKAKDLKPKQDAKGGMQYRSKRSE